MPVYVYLCPNCEEAFEVEKGMQEPHSQDHEECGYVGELGRVYFPPGIVFHGSGFYTTDKILSEITDPEYDLSPAEQVEYYDEKMKEEGISRGGGTGWDF